MSIIRFKRSDLEIREQLFPTSTHNHCTPRGASAVKVERSKASNTFTARSVQEDCRVVHVPAA
jgi:hypothetical protein